MRFPPFVVALLALFLVAAPTGAAAKSKKKKPKPRPDLVVSKASVTQSGSSLSGSFTIENDGKASAGKFTARITVRASKTRTKSVKSFSVSGLGKGDSLKVKVKSV